MGRAVTRDLAPPLSERGLSRAGFLRLIGAALSLAPASLSSMAAREGLAQTASPEILAQDGRFPIGVWWPPPPGKTTKARYAEIAKAGFNFVIGGNGVTTTDLHGRALKAAAATSFSTFRESSSLPKASNTQAQ